MGRRFPFTDRCNDAEVPIGRWRENLTPVGKPVVPLEDLKSLAQRTFFQMLDARGAFGGVGIVGDHDDGFVQIRVKLFEDG